MSEAKQCPHCGASLVDESSRPEPGTEPLADEPRAISLLAPGSNDETFLSTSYSKSVEPAEPDPILGQYVAMGTSATSVMPVVPASTTQTTRKSGSTNFPTINFDMPSPAPGTQRSNQSTSDATEDENDEPDDRRSGWAGVLVASYASAVTLALVWFVIKDRSRTKPEPPEVTKPESLVPPARQRELSKIVQPPEPIVAEHMANFGQPLEVGSLAITPLDVKRQDVKLQRSTVLAEAEQRDGGKKALVLRLKLRNISKNAAFAPLDQTYLRESPDRHVDTFVTTRDGERVYPYPLAIESEWSIVGQNFRELRPGESRTVAIVTAPDAPGDEAGPFTWSVRLRTGIDRTDVIGVVWPAPGK